MGEKKKGAAKGLLLFLIAMALLTFFSRTIYFGTLPKVAVRQISAGTLRQEISGRTFALDADDSLRLDVAADLAAYPLAVEEVRVQKMQQVTIGDVLLQFDAAIGNDRLEKAKAAFELETALLAAWQDAFQAAWTQAETDISSAISKMQKPDADMDALQADIDQAQKTLSSLEKLKMVDGVTLSQREYALNNAKAALTALTALEANGWRVLSPISGMMAEVHTAPAESYTGLAMLFKIIPEGAALRVGVEINSQLSISPDSSITVYDGTTNKNSKWAYIGETTSGSKRFIWAQSPEGTAALDGLSLLTFRIESVYYDYVVPNSAVVGDAIYVLDARVGAFGQEELFARRIELRNIINDDTNTVVLTGVSGRDRVITMWDRPFDDGDTVLLAFE